MATRMVTFSVLIALALFGLSHAAGTVDMGGKCKLTADCKSGLACDVRLTPVTNTCLGVQGVKCSKDLDCANGLMCMSGKCDCNATANYYNKNLNDCIPKQEFGGKCSSNSECADDNVCSKVGSLPNSCKADQGHMCASGKDCANMLNCYRGVCGCDAQFTTYNKATHNCDLNLLQNEGKACTKDSECGQGLSCDTSYGGDRTMTCRRKRGEFCNVAEDCVNALECDSQNLRCICLPDQFYDPATNECYSKRQYGEACLSNSYCDDSLACDLRIQQTPISYGRHNTCLKTFGMECKNGTECTNYLPCNNGFCGCRPNYKYNEILKDCFPLGDFGESCQSNDDCMSTMGCDEYADVCLGLPGAACAAYADCVNNVDCMDGVCACAKNETFDPKDKHCVRIQAGEEEVVAEEAKTDE